LVGAGAWSVILSAAKDLAPRLTQRQILRCAQNDSVRSNYSQQGSIGIFISTVRGTRTV
jgi:hypothetical protein